MTRRTLTLTCDHCGDLVRRHLAETETMAAVLPELRAQLFAEGWAHDDDGDTCPACTETAAEPVDLIPTQEIRA
ncbi:hypothetical protein ACFWPK_34465 [Nocardia sp. NPDC058519]|uniref:hypothetical protein n=1 Tax=Nocardia sp. NPDC058519 TaxID=3346535 RepID=UPI00365EFB92